jgi:hypothetical protein
VALSLGTAAIVLVALLLELSRPRAAGALRSALAAVRARRRAWLRGPAQVAYDPGRELRAEHRARELLRSCIDPEDWAMYRDLGFLRVWGNGSAGAADGHGVAPYAYLIYPHKPIVAYVPQSSRLLSEYCVDFPDRERPYGSTRLPPSDDVLAKWMALTADERRLIESANLHLAGRQHDPDAVRADIAALARWDGGRQRQAEATRMPAS